ncbi:unnamed protein product [Dracunculus medinensis]|uniref:MAGE domain-containing protein n=1 Tax=Dracunculus medinensis TaxID=318479 RepID=A0A0N4UJ98_DRAME|nr:unnamed protein product [Dracunculus medinensis]
MSSTKSSTANLNLRRRQISNFLPQNYGKSEQSEETKGIIKDSDLRGIFPKTTSKDTRQRIMEQLIERLDSIFGIKLVSISNEQINYWIAKNNLSIDVGTFFSGNSFYSIEEEAKYGILISALMFLFMAKNPKLVNSTVTENALLSFLHKMGFDGNDISKKNIIDIAKLISPKPSAEFVSKGWISYEKLVDKNGVETVIYKWGPRAHAVINPLEILKLFCKIDKSELESWKNHYDLAMEWRNRRNESNLLRNSYLF